MEVREKRKVIQACAAADACRLHRENSEPGSLSSGDTPDFTAVRGLDRNLYTTESQRERAESAGNSSDFTLLGGVGDMSVVRGAGGGSADGNPLSSLAMGSQLMKTLVLKKSSGGVAFHACVTDLSGTLCLCCFSETVSSMFASARPRSEAEFAALIAGLRDMTSSNKSNDMSEPEQAKDVVAGASPRLELFLSGLSSLPPPKASGGAKTNGVTPGSQNVNGGCAGLSTASADSFHSITSGDYINLPTVDDRESDAFTTREAVSFSTVHCSFPLFATASQCGPTATVRRFPTGSSAARSRPTCLELDLTVLDNTLGDNSPVKSTSRGLDAILRAATIAEDAEDALRAHLDTTLNMRLSSENENDRTAEQGYGRGKSSSTTVASSPLPGGRTVAGEAMAEASRAAKQATNPISHAPVADGNQTPFGSVSSASARPTATNGMPRKGDVGVSPTNPSTSSSTVGPPASGDVPKSSEADSTPGKPATDLKAGAYVPSHRVSLLQFGGGSSTQLIVGTRGAANSPNVALFDIPGAFVGRDPTFSRPEPSIFPTCSNSQGHYSTARVEHQNDQSYLEAAHQSTSETSTDDDAGSLSSPSSDSQGGSTTSQEVSGAPASVCETAADNHGGRLNRNLAEAKRDKPSSDGSTFSADTRVLGTSSASTVGDQPFTATSIPVDSSNSIPMEPIPPFLTFSTEAAHSQLLGGDFLSSKCLVTCGAPTDVPVCDDFHSSLGVWDLLSPPHSRLVLRDKISTREYANSTVDALINTRVACLWPGDGGNPNNRFASVANPSSVRFDTAPAHPQPGTTQEDIVQYYHDVSTAPTEYESLTSIAAPSRTKNLAWTELQLGGISSSSKGQRAANVNAFAAFNGDEINDISRAPESAGRGHDRIVLVTNRKGDVRWFDLRTQRYIHRIEGHEAAVKQLLVLDAQNFVTIDHSGGCRRWQTSHGRGGASSSAPAATLSRNPTSVTCLETRVSLHASTSLLQRTAVVSSAQVLGPSHFITSGLDGQILMHRV
ncbi:unnamed protein product [Amoebophrya sp. A25]|nr:unnamed protein product [Amoebophrya sp. A25]|eukprot:GSA25T00011502001.1